MTEWEPATDAELAMRDALRTDDQESYFRILSGAELLLPVSADALAGRAPLGWGTWSSGGRTHVLAFTSPSALRACLADYAGSARQIAYADLAEAWPNLEWWLAVNPGLPIEGYLPAWFVAQLARGDLRLPVRGPHRDAGVRRDTPAATEAARTTVEPAAARTTVEPAADPAAVPVPAGAGYADTDGEATRAVPAGSVSRAAGALLGGNLPARTSTAPSASSAAAAPAATAQPAATSTSPSVQADSASTVGPPAVDDDAPADGRFVNGSLAAESPAVVAPPGDDPPGDDPPGDAPTADDPTVDDPSVDGASAATSPSGGATAADGAEAGKSTVPAVVRNDEPVRPATVETATVEPATVEPATVEPTVEPVMTGLSTAGPAAAEPPTADPPGGPTPGGPLPRRPLTPASERPSSMAAAAQAIVEARTSPPAPQPSPTPATPAATPADAPAASPARDPEASPDPADEFVPANEVEQDLLNAADGGNTDIFLSTLLLATVLVPVVADSRPGSAPGEPGFAYRTEDNGGETFLVVFTSQDRLAEHHPTPVRTHGVRFFELISNWPDGSWSFAVNPGSPVGAKLPGSQVVALANWAAEAGLGTDDPVAESYERVAEPVPAPHTPPTGGPPQAPTVMQKTVPPEQVGYFLERGYDRVSGFVHRANEVEHLRTPAELYAALGLGYEGSPHAADAAQSYVLRWPAYRPSLYRIPYGGQGEQALRAMDGWVIERPPFRGNGFAPGEGRDVIAEFKVDSARLPHGSELWRIDADGGQELVAVFDCDQPAWRRLGGH